MRIVKSSTYLGAVLARVLAQFAVGESSMAQQGRPVAEAAGAHVALEGVFRVLVNVDQMLVEPVGSNDIWSKA